MSVEACISRLASAGKISPEQANTARKLYRGIVSTDAVSAMDAATREGYAALKVAQVLEDAAKGKKLELARRTEVYNSNLERIKAHPDGPIAGFMGLYDRDIRNVAGDQRVNVTSLEREHYAPQIAAKMHTMDAAYRSSLGGLKQDTAGVRNMIREMFGIRTGDRIAADAAKGWTDATDFGATTAKSLGKVFDTDKDWRFPQPWTSARVNKAGGEQFKADMNAEISKGGVVVIDPQTHMAVKGDEAQRVLNEATDHIRLDMTPRMGPSSIFKQESRTFRFTDGEAGSGAYLRMMDKYGVGQGNYYAAMQGHAQTMARELAMLHVMGPGFRTTADQLLQDAIKGGRAAANAERDRLLAGGAPKAVGKAEGIENALAHMGFESEAAATNLNDYMTGRLSTPGTNMMAGFFQGLRAFIVATKLGTAPLTAVPGDAANWIMASRFRGLDTGRLASEIFTSLFRSADREALATRLGITAHAVSRVAIGTKQYGDQMFGTGAMARVADFTVRASGLHAYDAAMSRSFPMEFMASIGDRAGKAFDQLDAPFKSFISDYGFKPDEWNQIANSGEDSFLTDGRNKYFKPDSLQGELRAKLMSAVGDEKQFAYLAGGSSRMRAMSASRDAGTLKGELGRSFFMFKTFAMSILATHGMRAAQEAAAGRLSTAVQLGLFTTIAGAIAIEAKAVASGKDPRDVLSPSFWGEAALQGGALGIYGDFLKSAVTGTGAGLGEVFSGPMTGVLGTAGRFLSGSVGNVEDDVSGNGKKQSNVGGAFAQLLRQVVPGSNNWYIQMLYNRAIVDNIQRMLDPSASKSFERAQQKALKDNGQRFYWAPGTNAPQRPPDLSAAVR